MNVLELHRKGQTRKILLQENSKMALHKKIIKVHNSKRVKYIKKKKHEKKKCLHI